MHNVKRIFRDFIRNVAAGLRLVLFLRIGASTFRAGPAQIILVIIGATGLSLLAAWALIGPESRFNPYGVGHFAGRWAASLFACFLAAIILRQTESFGRFFIAFEWAKASLGIFATAVFTLLTVASIDLGAMQWHVLYWTFFACSGFVAFRATRVVFGRGRAAAAGISACMLAVFFAYNAIPGIPILYPASPQGGATSKKAKTVNVEATYYRQQALLDRSFRDLAPQRAGTTDLYFVAFGGYASQDVFLREVRSISDLFDSRFGTAGRSIRLVNNPATIRQYPLANGHNLDTTLREIGKRLDPREDVLFLFLTSHGAPNRLAVDFWPLRLNDLSAHALRAMLDRSGIKWRIIVISACYSGSFIDALADENTLVMTAARHDRTSFGCANENDFTYFGKAYFDEALRETFSFTHAFDKAAKTIEKRERSEGLDPSFPQIAVGKAIAPKLDALTGHFRRRAEGQTANRPPRR